MLFQGLGKVFYNFVVIFVLAFTVTVIMFYKFFGFISIGRILIFLLIFILAISLGYCLLK